MWNVGTYPIEKQHRKSTNSTRSEYQFHIEDMPTELRSAPVSRTRLNWKDDHNISTEVRPRSSRFCQTDSEENTRKPEDKFIDTDTETGTMNKKYVDKKGHKINSQLPGIQPSRHVITSPVLHADVTKSVISITKSSELPIPNERDTDEIGNFPFKSDVNFDLSMFCCLLKEQFRELLFKERTDPPKATDTTTITNLLIYCFRKSSGGPSEKFRTPVPKMDDLSSNDADVENNVSSNNYVNEPTIEQHEALVDKAIDQFVDDTYKFVVTARDKRKNSGNTAAPGKKINITKDEK
ncbi:hypothetical protein TNIN_356281 [Trichonephila inaurata madagascariensis]|uniref:Uncharacterized protein n=1 Tax=Trichonephila inaurata madagascariensis TaxID=2747483 RepID=A0A8X6X0Y8_9ARAC|nr:hypothetical protein TNIN_356281 [Trichonephila inaurata madagascariensis]